MSVIFVAGVHGVGKTTGCIRVSQSLGVIHATASQIIRDGKASGITDVGKVVHDMDGNQRVLIRGVQQVLARERHLLLDGHFTLRTKEGIEPIPLRVFELLSITAVAIFVDDPSQIAQRISSRDQVAHDPAVVLAHQEAELKHACHIAESLAVPVAKLPAFDAGSLADHVRGWLSIK